MSPSCLLLIFFTELNVVELRIMQLTINIYRSIYEYYINLFNVAIKINIPICIFYKLMIQTLKKNFFLVTV